MSGPKPTFQAHVYSNLSSVSFSLSSYSTFLSGLPDLGSFSTSLSDISTSVSGVATLVGGFPDFITIATSLSDLKTSLSAVVGGGGGGSTTEAQTFQLDAASGALGAYNHASQSQLFSHFPTTLDISGNSRPFYMDTNNEHFFTTTKLVRGNGLFITADDSTVTLFDSFSNSFTKEYILIDAKRQNLVKGSAIRVFNDWDPTSLSVGTFTVATVEPLFSLTGCSYSMFPPGPNMWASSSCRTLAQTIQTNQDLSTIYVMRGYSDFQSQSATFPSASLYWAFRPGDSLTSLSAPEVSSYYVRQNELDLTINPRLTSISSYFVPLLPNEDSWALLRISSVSASATVYQYNSQSGLGNFGNYGEVFFGSQTSLSYIGGFEWNTSLSSLVINKNQFLFFYSDSNNVSPVSYSDNIYLCVGDSCTQIVTGSMGSYTLQTGFHSMSANDLLTTYTLIRSYEDFFGGALDSITLLQSVSLYNHPYSLTTLTMITSALKGHVLGDVQPQENLTFVNKSLSTNYSVSDKYSKIPSILNPSDVLLNAPLLSPFVYKESNTNFVLYNSTTGPYRTVTIRLDTVSFNSYSGANQLSLTFNHSLTSVTNFVNFGGGPSILVANDSKTVNIGIPYVEFSISSAFSFDIVFNDFPSSLLMSYTTITGV
jgi:hypothetical protein